MLSSSPVFAQITDINDAINKSGRQRMLSQRLAKCYFQLGQAIDPVHSKQILDASMAQFDRQLIELSVFSPTAENKNLLTNLGKTWNTYKEALIGREPNQRDAKSILSINDEILAMAQESTMQLEKLSGTMTSKIVNIAGRQRMLSQRMAEFYQAINWGIAPPEAESKLMSARKEYIDAMGFLNNYAGNTSEIKSQLDLGKQQWVFFDYAVTNNANKQQKNILAGNVATTSERILEVMDHVSNLYARMA